MKNIIKIIILFSFFTILNNSLSAQYNNIKVLEPDKYRTGKVLDKTAIIRFSKDFSMIEQKNEIAQNFNFRIVEPILKKQPEFDKIKFLENAEKLIETADVLGRTFVIQYDDDVPPEVFIKRLRDENPAIELAEPYRVHQFLEYYPSDTKVFNQVVLDIIGAFDAWEIYKGSEDIIIGISDSGCDQEHEDLKDNIAVFENEIEGDMLDNDGNGYIDDYNGYNFAWQKDSTLPNNTSTTYDHGTNVTGIAAAVTDNNKGIAGAGFKSKFFPLKISDKYDNILYGYQSIIYAADNGFDVLNLSWGSPGTPSEYEQSVIDYAVARDVAMVAGAGNKEYGMSNYLTFYPAGYNGVLGAGESDYIDMFAQEASMVGVSCDILAMSEGNHTTKSGNGYKTVTGGTSFSSPVVAGVLAIARGKYPELSAIQAIEFVRQTGDDVTAKNFFETDLLPKRVNMLNAVQADPFSIPAIVPSEYKFMNTTKVQLDRFLPGDTVKLSFIATNHLKAADNLTFTISVGYEAKQSIEIINDEVFVESFQNDETKEIGEFSFVITDNNNSEVIFRLDITDENGYSDFRKFGFEPTKSYTTFRNDNFAFSMSDFGYFGNYVVSSSESYGAGFEYADYGNQIYQNSGLIAAQGLDKGVLFFLDDFMPIKEFAGEEPNIGIVNDGFAPSDRRIGIEIEQEVILDNANQNYFAIKLRAKNKTIQNMQDISVGYFIDWDINTDVNSNYTELLPEAIPEELQGSQSAAQLAGFAGEDFPVFGMAVTTQEPNSIAQSAGLVYNQFRNLEESFAINMLNGGTSFQNADATDDVGIVTGMKFGGNLAPEQSKECKICFSAAETKQQLITNLKQCLGNGVSVNRTETIELSVYPQPASDNITITSNLLNDSWAKIRIFDVFGNDVLQKNVSISETNSSNLNIDISELSSGKYFISVSNGTSFEVIPLTVLK
jgi:hypothetical protein